MKFERSSKNAGEDSQNRESERKGEGGFKIVEKKQSGLEERNYGIICSVWNENKVDLDIDKVNLIIVVN